jgi:transcriptional regulator with XRE-family HTH domain
MLYNELLNKLVCLTNRNNISQLEIGRAIGAEKGAINARAKRNSKFKPDEIKKIEEAFDIKLDSISIINNSGDRISDDTVEERTENFGKRLFKIQEKNDLTDRQMAKLLGIYEDEYVDLVYGDKEPNMRVLNNIKSHFQVSIDYLLYGE